MKKILLFLILGIIFCDIAKSQNTPVLITDPDQSLCNIYLYDDGGSGGNYNASRDDNIVINSNNPSFPNVRFNFPTFDVHPSDTLYIYDGNSLAAPLLGWYNNSNTTAPFAVQASINNSSGSLTFRFKTDAVNQAAGFWGSEVCIPQCQAVVSSLSQTECIPTPALENYIQYIDVCFGDQITFAAATGSVAFPENDHAYHQDESTSIYNWDFGDGTTATGRVVTHTYTAIRGYDVSLTITDVHGCTNANALGARVRISRNPYVAVHPLPAMCSGTEVTVNVGSNNSNVIVINTTSSTQRASERFDSILFVPDGPNCPQQCYNTFVTFNSFAPGQTIQTANDVLSICVGMEHSYAGDLGFRIICPNGTAVQLDPNTHSGGSYLGTPYGGSNHGNYDNGCNPVNNPYGTPGVYCWSQYYNPPTTRTMDWLSNNGGTTIPQTDTINNSNYIYPTSSLAGLIGCPLNGTWNIEICDDYGIDNGYIFWWTLNLDPRLLPVGWSYSVGIDSVIWDGNFIHPVNDSTINVLPTNGGTYQYTVTLVDDYGCRYDTTFTINVVAQPVVNLGPNDTICNGEILNLDAGGPFNSYLWSTGESGQTIDVSATDYYWVYVQNNSSGITCSNSDTMHLFVGTSPNADFIADVTQGCEPVTVHFRDNTDPGGPNFGSYAFLWDFGDGTTSTTRNPVHTYDHYGMYTVTLTVSTVLGCTDTEIKTAFIQVWKQPEAAFTTTPENGIVTVSSPVIQFNDQSSDVDNYNWNFGDGTNSTESSPSHTYTIPSDVDNQVFTVILTTTSREGCIDTASVQIRIINDVLVYPNVITPNGDGINDKFEIQHLNGYKNNNLVIYSRWGKKIFEKSGYDNSWDCSGGADGTYYFVLTCEGYINDFELNGTITVIRGK